jgi:hypothetical protein
MNPMSTLNLKHSAEARFWFLNLGAFLTAGLLSAVVGARLEPFLWLLLLRPLAAMAITLLRPTSAGDLRPYLLAATLACLATVPFVNPSGAVFPLAVMALYCLVDPSLDALMARHCPDFEWLGRMGQLVLMRSCGLGVGLLAGTFLAGPDWGRPIFAAGLLALALMLALVSERPDRCDFWPSLVGTEIRRATLIDSLAQWRGPSRLRLSGHQTDSGREAVPGLLGAAMVLFAVAVLAGTFQSMAYSVALLTPLTLSEWLARPGHLLGALLMTAVLALLLERLPQQTLNTLCYPLLLLAMAARLTGPPHPAIPILLQMACGLALLVAFRQTLAAQPLVDPTLRAALPSTIWSLGLLAGQTPLGSQALNLARAACCLMVLIALIATLRSWQTPTSIRSVEVQRSDPREGRHGDKTIDFEAAPGVVRKRRSRWLSRLWYALTVRFPVTLTLAALTALVVAGVWHARDHKDSWEQRTHGVWVAMKSQLFLTALKHRAEEEMLASNRVPSNWAHFIAIHFELDGRPLKDRDFWGTPLHFETHPKHVRIVSAGPDKKLFTSDDLERSAHKPDGVR